MSMDSAYPNGTKRQTSVNYTAAEDENPSEAVIAALREATGRSTSPDAGGEDGNMLEPLFDTIDPDALDALFSSRNGTSTRSGTVTFTHVGFEVTVSAAGDVTVVDA